MEWKEREGGRDKGKMARERKSWKNRLVEGRGREGIGGGRREEGEEKKERLRHMK